MTEQQNLTHDVLELAESIANSLGKIEGVVAVSLDGGWASGESDLDTDINLGLYYRDTNRPDVDALRDFARRLNNSLSADVVTDFWAHGPLMNGGALLWVEGQRIDWHYREIEYVKGEIENARRGVVMGHYQPGYPQGFFSHYLVGIVDECRPLYDPLGELAKLKAETATYPAPLKDALLRNFVREADLTLFAAQKAAIEEDVYFTVGCLQRCVSCMIHALFAVNERYITHERRALEKLMRLDERPDHFADLVKSVLANPGSTVRELQDSVSQLQGLVSEIQLEYVSPLDTGL
jgi:hypothetical protein